MHYNVKAFHSFKWHYNILLYWPEPSLSSGFLQGVLARDLTVTVPVQIQVLSLWQLASLAQSPPTRTSKHHLPIKTSYLLTRRGLVWKLKYSHKSTYLVGWKFALLHLLCPGLILLAFLIYPCWIVRFSFFKIDKIKGLIGTKTCVLHIQWLCNCRRVFI